MTDNILIIPKVTYTAKWKLHVQQNEVIFQTTISDIKQTLKTTPKSLSS